jgi:hypothetical protein
MPRRCQKAVVMKTSELGRRRRSEVYSFDTSSVRIRG